MSDKYPAQPVWITVKPVRSPAGGMEPSLADVDSHLPAGHPYKDGRHITWCHETTHGINAMLRNQKITFISVHETMDAETIRNGPYTSQLDLLGLPIPLGPLNPELKLGNLNACYILGDRGLTLPEPYLKLSDIARAVPQKLRGMSYDTYLIQQQRYWQDSPLYVFDEWSAYLNGLTCGLEGNLREASFSDLLQPLEFMGYAWTLWSSIPRNEAGTAMRDLLAYQTARTLMLYKMCQKSSIFTAKHEDYLAAFLTSPLRETATTWCGMAWCAQVFEEQDFHGIF